MSEIQEKLTEDIHRQKDEIDVLKSIYDPSIFFVFTSEEKTFIQIKTSIRVTNTLYVEYYEKEQDKNSVWRSQIKDLPPLWIGIFLPADYPSISPPQINIGSEWLGKHEIAYLLRKLDEIWLDNHQTEIIFFWISYIENCLSDLFPQNVIKLVENILFTEIGKERVQAIKSLLKTKQCHKVLEFKDGKFSIINPEFEKALEEPRAIDLSETLTCSLAKYLYDYDYEEFVRKINNSMQECKICYERYPGTQCKILLECRHIFCIECLKKFLKPQILKKRVIFECPANCEGIIQYHDVKDILDDFLKTYLEEKEAVIATLDSVARNRSLICPRVQCQAPYAYFDKKLNLIICPRCLSHFCALCSRISHGIEPCIDKAALDRKKLASEYIHASRKEAVALEKRYGPSLIKKAIAGWKTDEWLETHSKQCPSCETPIEKNQGCNKMCCLFCQMMFCWQCLKILNPLDPYSHFGNKCKIFDSTIQV